MSNTSSPTYRVILQYDAERKVFQARAPELEHCQGEGASRAEAIARLEDEIRAQVENMHAHGANPPAPVDEAALSGELRVKVSQSLHRELLWQARQEGVEVEQLLAELVAAGVEARRGARPRGRAQAAADATPHDNIGNTIGGGGRAGGRGYGNRYNPMLDDRANFIEYVRTLEQGSNQGVTSARGPSPGGPRNNNNNRRRGGPGGGGGGGNRGPGGSPGGGNPGNSGGGRV